MPRGEGSPSSGSLGRSSPSRGRPALDGLDGLDAGARREVGSRPTGAALARVPACSCAALGTVPRPLCARCHHTNNLHAPRRPGEIPWRTGMGCACRHWQSTEAGTVTVTLHLHLPGVGGSLT